MLRNKRKINYKLVCVIFAIIDIILFVNIFFEREVRKFSVINIKNYIMEEIKNQNVEDTTYDEIASQVKVLEIIEEVCIEKKEVEPEILTSVSGDSYLIIGTIKISKINLEMQITSKTTEELMKKYACRLWGPNVNKKGNLCIIGHNWRNTKLFSKVPNLEIGDTIELIDLRNNSKEYTIYDKYIVNPDEVDCLNQETNGETIITIITCTNDSSQRYVMHAK